MIYNSPQFDDIEMIKIKDNVKGNKFDNFNRVLYPNSVEQNLKNFIQCYKLLLSILPEINDVNITAKLKKYLLDIQLIDVHINEILLENREDFNSLIRRNRMNKFYIDNKINIDNFISYIYKFGKVTKLFDPEEEQAIY